MLAKNHVVRRDPRWWSAISLLTSIVMLGGCASEAAKKTQVQTPSASSAQPQGASCFNAPSSMALASIPTSKNECQIQVNEISLRKEGKLDTLANIVKASGKKVMIFQLVGATCIDCQEHSVVFDQKIAEKAATASIGHSIVFTDIQSEFPENQFVLWMQKAAKTSLRLHDEKGTLWMSLQSNPNIPDRSPIFAVRADGLGAFSNAKDQILTIFDRAVELSAKP